MNAQTALANIDPTQANCLIPTQQIQQVSPWHAARTSIVQVSSDPDAGDVFKVGSRPKGNNQFEDLYCLGKPSLMRIAEAAGIVWNWKDSGPVSLTRDYVCYKAVGALRLPDGSWQPIMATKEIDLSVIEDELRDQAAKKADKGVSYDDSKLYKGEWRKVKYGDEEKNVYFLAEEEKARYIATAVNTNLIQWRKNKLMRAETGAMLRVIRTALGIKSQYTKQELSKPFIVPRIDFAPDYNDPAVRQALIQNGIPAMAQLFGQSAPAALPSSQPFAGSHPALTAAPEPEEPEFFMDLGAGSGEAPSAPTQSDPNPPVYDALAGDGGQAGLFAGQSGQTGQAPAGNDNDVLAQCSECGAGIKSASVVEYSRKKFGQPRCYKCQQAAKGAQAS